VIKFKVRTFNLINITSFLVILKVCECYIIYYTLVIYEIIWLIM